MATNYEHATLLFGEDVIVNSDRDTIIDWVKSMLGDDPSSVRDAGITVEPEKPDELAKAVLDLIEKPERCATYGINGRRFVERNFSRRQLLNELLQKLN